jgi:5'-nucleotidase
MSKFGNIFILAPDHNWSASGHVRTLDRPLRVKEVVINGNHTGFACDGAPSDCVALAAGGFFYQKMDLVVSGINTFANLGHDVTYSGTVTAAMEALIWGIPGIAFSLDQPDNYQEEVDFGPSASAAARIVQTMLKNRLPSNVLLNVNIPFLSDDQIRGVQVTRQGLRVYHDQLDRRTDPRNRPYYWIIGEPPTSIAESGTDVGALTEGYISVTPISLDLTAYPLIPEMLNWEWGRKEESQLIPITPSQNPDYFQIETSGILLPD